MIWIRFIFVVDPQYNNTSVILKGRGIYVYVQYYRWLNLLPLNGLEFKILMDPRTPSSTVTLLIHVNVHAWFYIDSDSSLPAVWPVLRRLCVGYCCITCWLRSKTYMGTYNKSAFEFTFTYKLMHNDNPCTAWLTSMDSLPNYQTPADKKNLKSLTVLHDRERYFCPGIMYASSNNTGKT